MSVYYTAVAGACATLLLLAFSTSTSFVDGATSFVGVDAVPRSIFAFASGNSFIVAFGTSAGRSAATAIARLRAGGPHSRHACGTSPSSLFVSRRTVAVRRQPWMSFQRGGIGSEKG